MYLVKHEIRVVGGEPFKKRLQRIPPLMVDEVHVHVKEMLEMGAICSSQSPWYNAFVLVFKKDRGLHFCIDFCKLNARTKKDSYPLPQIQETIESLVGAGYFTCLDLKVGFWQITMEEASKQYSTFTMGNLGFFECECMLVGLCNASCHFSEVNAELPRGTEPDILLNQLGQCNSLLKDRGGALKCLQIVFDSFHEHNLRLKPPKCKFIRDEINYLAHHVSKEGMQPSQRESKSCGRVHSTSKLTHKFEPSWAWWGTIGNSSRDCHTLHNLYLSMYLEKVPIRRVSE